MCKIESLIKLQLSKHVYNNNELYISVEYIGYFETNIPVNLIIENIIDFFKRKYPIVYLSINYIEIYNVIIIRT